MRNLFKRSQNVDPIGGTEEGKTEVISWDAKDRAICEECEADVPAWDIEGGQCEDCRNEASYGGTHYCCGAIYEEGETECHSCGEPL